MNAYFNLFIFILITIAYFNFGKKDISTENTSQDYNTNFIYLMFYFIAVLISQMVLNVIYVSQLCNTSVNENIGSGSLLAFFPWFFIFGIVLVVLFIYPGLKSVFSNVIGYFIVSSQANQILGELLENPEIENQLNNIVNKEEKTEFKKTADLILRICSDKSILINEMNPFNYDKMFEQLKILFNPNIAKNAGDIEEKKKKLKNIITRKDNIGEFCWYLYTGIFLTSVVSYNTAARGCKKNITTMKNNFNDYKKETEKIQENNIANNQLYS